MASTYLTRTVGTPTNIDKYTFSVWIKRTDIGAANSKIFSVSSGSAYGEEKLEFNADDLKFNLTDTSGNDLWSYTTNRKFRDSLGWYHLVLSVDTTLGTAADRVKLYVNGVQETSFSSSTNSPQNQDSYINKSGSTLYIGRLHSSSDQFFGGIMSYMHFIDGTAYPASTFGEADSNGVWTIKTSPSVTYGDNGFFILKDGNSVTDQSGEGNNLTVGGGTLTATEDCPSDVFCTLNPLADNTSILSSGNTVNSGDATNTTSKGTICPAKGKYYWEAKITTASSDYPMLGIYGVDTAAFQKPADTSYPGQVTPSYGIYGNGNVYANGSNTGSQSFTYATHDIIGTALDLDSATKVITWYKNGSQIATYNLASTTQAFSVGDYNGGNSTVISYNFGNGYFGTTAITSEGTNASGIGKFEFDVPTGYTALSTKGLNN